MAASPYAAVLRRVLAVPGGSGRPHPSTTSVRQAGAHVRVLHPPCGHAHTPERWCRQSICHSSFMEFVARVRFLPMQVEPFSQKGHSAAPSTVVVFPFADDLLQMLG